MASVLDDILTRYRAAPEKERLDSAKEIVALTKNMVFIPNPGAQTAAYLSKADILLYGGAAGGGKTFLLLGTAANDHQSSIIFRRESSQTDGLEKDGKLMIGSAASYNGSDNVWDWGGGKALKLAGMKDPDDWMKHAGRERDFIGFDEAGEFLEVQVASIIFGWLRAPAHQRCRVVLGSNPPRTSDGSWMRKWFAPWLDPNFSNPALPGELRWAVQVDGKIIWVDNNDTVTIDGEEYTPKSYTFIPALLKDNPFRDTPEYRSSLQSQREPLRSQLLYGDFTAGQKDEDYQLIPSAWVDAAMNRWTPQPPEGMAMTAIGYDPAGGGRDSAELAIRYGGWYAPLISVQGEETADGSASAATIVKHRRDNAGVVVDCDGGYGGSVCMRLEDNGIQAIKYKGSEGSLRKSKDGKYPYANKRSDAWHTFRDELDPSQEGGSVIALPPDPELRADLVAVTWSLSARGLAVEPKVKIGDGGKVVGGLRKKLGRSPGKGDAVVMALAEGNRAVMRIKNANAARNGQTPVAQFGYAHMKKRRHNA